MSSKMFSSDLYDPSDGPMPADPFGEEIKYPTSRQIPTEYHGRWSLQNSHSADTLTIESDQFALSESRGMQPVVAVRMTPSGIAVVSQAMDGGKWLYSLNYFGLNDDHSVLVDLESMDIRWVRI